MYRLVIIGGDAAGMSTAAQASVMPLHDRRAAPALAGLGVASLWALLALARPTTTWHLAPVLSCSRRCGPDGSATTAPIWATI